MHDSSISKTPDRSEWIFNIEVSVGITLSLVALLCIYLCCRGRSVPEASQALYIKVDTSEQDVELTGLRAGRGVDLSDARLDESDLNSGRV